MTSRDARRPPVLVLGGVEIKAYPPQPPFPKLQIEFAGVKLAIKTHPDGGPGSTPGDFFCTMTRPQVRKILRTGKVEIHVTRDVSDWDAQDDEENYSECRPMTAEEALDDLERSVWHLSYEPDHHAISVSPYPNFCFEIREIFSDQKVLAQVEQAMRLANNEVARAATQATIPVVAKNARQRKTSDDEAGFSEVRVIVINTPAIAAMRARGLFKQRPDRRGAYVPFSFGSGSFDIQNESMALWETVGRAAARSLTEALGQEFYVRTFKKDVS